MSDAAPEQEVVPDACSLHPSLSVCVSLRKCMAILESQCENLSAVARARRLSALGNMME